MTAQINEFYRTSDTKAQLRQRLDIMGVELAAARLANSALDVVPDVDVVVSKQYRLLTPAKQVLVEGPLSLDQAKADSAAYTNQTGLYPIIQFIG